MQHTTAMSNILRVTKQACRVNKNRNCLYSQPIQLNLVTRTSFPPCRRESTPTKRRRRRRRMRWTSQSASFSRGGGGTRRRRGLGQQHWHLLDSCAPKEKPSTSLWQSDAICSPHLSRWLFTEHFQSMVLESCCN